MSRFFLLAAMAALLIAAFAQAHSVSADAKSAADLDRDGTISILDITIVFDTTDARSDVNEDGIADGWDVIAVLQQYSRQFSATLPTPTPTIDIDPTLPPATPTATLAPATATATGLPPTNTPRSGLPTNTPTPTITPRSGLPTVTPQPTSTGTPSSTPTGVHGVIVHPLDDLQAMVDANPAGTAFQLSPGTYRNQSISPKSGDVFRGEGDAILDGTNTTAHAFRGSGQTGVRIEGLIIQNYNSLLQAGAIQLDNSDSSSWVISNNELRNNAAYGIRGGGNGNQMLGNYVHHNGQAGLGATGGTNILVQGNDIAFNNTRNIDQYWEAGGTKFTRTSGLVLRNNTVRDNRGPGLWTDIDNVDVLVEGNTITNNEGPGIFHEISYAAIIRNNTVSGNGAVENGCGCWLWGSQIQISTSQNVEVYGNTVIAPPDANGIGVLQQDRGLDGIPVNIHNNHITLQAGGNGGRTGAVQDYNPNNFFANVTLDHNTYHVANISAVYWAWNNDWLTWTQLRAAGQELHGAVDTSLP